MSVAKDKIILKHITQWHICSKFKILIGEKLIAIDDDNQTHYTYKWISQSVLYMIIY